MASRLHRLLLPLLCALGALALVAAVPARAAEAPGGLGLVYLDRSEVGLGDVQSIAVLAEEDAPELADVALTLARTDGAAERSLEAAKVADGAALVEFANDDAALAGAWRVADVTLAWADGTQSALELEEDESLTFTLLPEPLATGDAVYTALNDDGDLLTTADLGDVVDDASPEGAVVSTLDLARTLSEPTADTLAHAIVALDPGHGAEDGGATGIGFLEKDVNWKISMATKQWLEERGVRVFVTHGQNESPNPSISERVDRAVDAGACVLVSQHNNETPSGSGFEIYVPYDSDYYANIHDVGLDFGHTLESKLAGLGLIDRGVRQTNCDYTYPNGDLQDYYGVIRYSRMAGMTGFLVEHAFVDNEHDAALLRDDAFLTRLGIADAEAIYEHLNDFYSVYLYNQAHPWGGPQNEEIEDAVEGSVFRLYNQWSGEHLFTTDKDEATDLEARRWTYEGIEWVSPNAGAAVYRLYNPNTVEHLYTTDQNEYATLGQGGWVQEGIKLHVADGAADGAIPIYRLYNPFEDRHIFTTALSEYDDLGDLGWSQEGVKFHGLDPESVAPEPEPEPTPTPDPEPEPEPEPATHTPIMGQSATSLERLEAWFAARMELLGREYPQIYAENPQYGATTPEAFVEVLWREASAEGVRPDVLLAQVIHETGWLQFGGMVLPEDCNFGGLGATDSEENRNIATFDDIATGLRAQAQHLRAYADPNVTIDTLAGECVDPRFGLVSPKGKAPIVEKLSKNWSSGATYGQSIVALMEEFPNDLAY